jgi:type IV pilus assembly protein PilO
VIVAVALTDRLIVHVVPEFLPTDVLTIGPVMLPVKMLPPPLALTGPPSYLLPPTCVAATAPPATAAPAALDPDILSDTSFGPSLAGKLRRKKFKVEFEGNFAQTRNFMRNLELMQSLLVVRNLKSELLSSTQPIEVDFVKGKIVPVAQPPTVIKTAFDLHALLPLKEEEKPPTPAPSPGAK